MTLRTMIALSMTAAMAVTITFLALTPSDLPLPIATSDKSRHFMAFAVLSLPVAVLRPRYLPWAVIAFAAFGGLIELVQPSFGRTRDIEDFYADLWGIGAGSLIGLGLHLWRMRKRLQPDAQT